MKLGTIAFLVGALALSGPMLASAEGQQSRSAAIDAMKKREAEVERQRASVATKLNAADYQHLARQRARVDELIQRMDAGQSVTPEEIDRAFGLGDAR